MNIRKQKADFILDQICRVIANPGNAAKVAEAIAADWNPIIYIDKDGSSRFKLKDEDGF